MWALLEDLNSPQKQGRTAAAPPLSKGMWVVYCRSTEDWGREKHKGGPRKWEAHAVHLKNEPRLPSWFVFAIYPPIPALLTSLGRENDP